jgi:hypothetical protein
MRDAHELFCLKSPAAAGITAYTVSLRDRARLTLFPIRCGGHGALVNLRPSGTGYRPVKESSALRVIRLHRYRGKRGSLRSLAHTI